MSPAPGVQNGRRLVKENGVRLNVQRLLVLGHVASRNPRFKQTVPIDEYVLDVLMRDLIGHEAGRLPGLSASLRPGCTKQMAPCQRQCAHDCRCHRAVQKRRPRGTDTLASPPTHQDGSALRHCYSTPSRSSTLAEVITRLYDNRFGRRQGMRSSRKLLASYERGERVARQLFMRG